MSRHHWIGLLRRVSVSAVLAVNRYDFATTIVSAANLFANVRLVGVVRRLTSPAGKVDHLSPNARKYPWQVYGGCKAK